MHSDRGEGGSDGSPDAPGDALAADLRTLIGLRSRTAVRDRPLPALDALLAPPALADPDARHAARTELVDTAVAAVVDDAHRAAARHLLASGPDRWRPLKARGAEAGGVFGCGWDAYRRRRTSGSSLLEETLDEVARAARASSTVEATPAPDRTHDDGTDDDRPRPVVVVRPTVGAAAGAPAPATGRRAMTVAAGVGLAAVGLAVVALVTTVTLSPRTDPPTASATAEAGAGSEEPVRCGALQYAVGHVPADADPALVSWGERFAAFAAADESVPAACAAPLARSGPNAVQLVSAGVRGSNGALVGNDPGGVPVVVGLGPSEVRQYNRPTDPDGPELGEPVWTLLGGLVERADRPGVARMVTFETGALVTDVVESPTYAVTGRWFELWEESGGLDGPLGRPVTDRLLDGGTGTLVQYFVGGHIAASVTDAVPEVVVTPDDPLLRLPPDHRNAVVVEALSTTAWFVDAEGVRHWIRDIGSFGCAEGIGVRVHTRQPPTAVAALPGGEPFTCP